MADRTFLLMVFLVLAVAFLFSSAGTTGNVPKGSQPRGDYCSSSQIGETRCGLNGVIQCLPGEGRLGVWSLVQTQQEVVDQLEASGQYALGAVSPDNVRCVNGEWIFTEAGTNVKQRNA